MTVTIAHWDAIATAAVGTQVQITCAAKSTMPDGATAFTMQGADGSILHTVVLSNEDCNGLRHADSYDKAPPIFFTVDGVRAEDQGASIEILAHESFHVGFFFGTAGDASHAYDESAVECSAITNVWQWIKPLHLASKLNRWLMAGAMMGHRNTPDSYRLDC